MSVTVGANGIPSTVTMTADVTRLRPEQLSAAVMEATLGARWRALVHRGRHIGATLLERKRLGEHDKIRAGYDDLREVLEALRR